MPTDLWNKIQHFPLDAPDATQPFSAKLASQNRWDSTFTKQAIEEYKRFLYLCAVEESTMTPSKVIDTVWHLHLTYTRNYWDDLCRDTLGKAIHHTPSDGSEADSSKYSAAYSETLRSYTRHFGSIAPSAIWGLTPPKINSRKPNGCLRASIVVFTLFFSQIAIASGMIPFFIMLPIAVFIIILAFASNSFLGAGCGSSGASLHSSDSSGCGADSSCGSDCGSSCGGGCGGD